MYGYLQNVKINVSNAKRNIPNVSSSIKETLIFLLFLCFLFFIGITPILLKWKVSPPCNTIDFLHNHIVNTGLLQQFST